MGTPGKSLCTVCGHKVRASDLAQHRRSDPVCNRMKTERDRVGDELRKNGLLRLGVGHARKLHKHGLPFVDELPDDAQRGIGHIWVERWLFEALNPKQPALRELTQSERLAAASAALKED